MLAPNHHFTCPAPFKVRLPDGRMSNVYMIADDGNYIRFSYNKYGQNCSICKDGLQYLFHYQGFHHIVMSARKQMLNEHALSIFEAGMADEPEASSKQTFYGETWVTEDEFRASVRRRFDDSPFAFCAEHISRDSGHMWERRKTERLFWGVRHTKNCDGEMLLSETKNNGDTLHIFYKFTKIRRELGNGYIFFRDDAIATA